jgi:acetylornithine deacetylase/succinyl-diaminopimelate desuccinylase-like protein
VIVTGLEAGYTGKGYRNSIPNTARAKVNFRLVKSQNPDKIGKFFREFVKKELPDYVDFKLKVEDPYDGIKLDLDNKYVETARSYLTDAFGAEALVKFCGGGLPIVTHFNEVLGVPQILAPLANEDCAMHAANENYDIEILEKAMEFSRMFWNKE